MIKTSHPTERALRHFVSGELEAGATRHVVRHLLAGCDECREITGRLWPVCASGPDESAYGDLELRLDDLRAREEDVRGERKLARHLLANLEAQPPNRRMLLVLNSKRYHSWFLAELLLARAHESGFDDPAKSLALADLGVALAEQLPVARYGEPLVNDMRGRAWGTLGNARRLNSDLAGAREAFRRAEQLLAAGTGDPLEEARLLAWRAVYLKFQREIDASVRLYDRAIGIYRRLGETHHMGRMMIDKATTRCTAGDFAGAIRWTEAGIEHIDTERDPRFALAAKHNLSLYLHRDGDIDRAMGLLQEILPLFAQQNDSMVLLRLRWLEGRLAQAQRQFDRAEAAFREVQRGYAERGIPYEAASVSFDLATILVEEQRYEELAQLATEIVGIFQGLGIPRETLAALELFQKAVQARRLTVSWISELAAYVERSRSKPGQPFRPLG